MERSELIKKLKEVYEGNMESLNYMVGYYSGLEELINMLRKENKELKKEISNYKRRVTNLKKTRILKGTKEQKQIIKVKLGASTKTTVRKHLKKEIEEVKSND